MGGTVPENVNGLRTWAATMVALVAFAANSVLCRVALGESAIDAASFSTIRLASGAAMLWLTSAALTRKVPRKEYGGDWVSASLLFLYAVPFSFAYVTLSTGTGALILFGSNIAALRSPVAPSAYVTGPMLWMLALLAQEVRGSFPRAIG